MCEDVAHEPVSRAASSAVAAFAMLGGLWASEWSSPMHRHAKRLGNDTDIVIDGALVTGI